MSTDFLIHSRSYCNNGSVICIEKGSCHQRNQSFALITFSQAASTELEDSQTSHRICANPLYFA